VLCFIKVKLSVKVKLFIPLLCVCIMLPGKAVPKMTYTVSGRTLSPTHLSSIRSRVRLGRAELFAAVVPDGLLSSGDVDMLKRVGNLLTACEPKGGNFPQLVIIRTGHGFEYFGSLFFFCVEK